MPYPKAVFSIARLPPPLPSESSRLEQKYGPPGTEKRDQYDSTSLAYRLGIMLKEARREAILTQDELAERSGTQKSYISRIERG